MIGGCLTLAGAIGLAAVFQAVSANLATGWSTPPGRFLSTVAELDISIWLAGFCILLLCGLLILTIEYFRKDNKDK